MTYEELVQLASDEQIHILEAAAQNLHKAGRIRTTLTNEQWASTLVFIEAVEQEVTRRRATTHG